MKKFKPKDLPWSENSGNTFDSPFGKVRDVSFDYPVLEMAQQVVCMGHELQRLRETAKERDYYRTKYNELLQDSIRHGREMTGSLLQLALTPGVLESCAKAAKVRGNVEEADG